MHRCLALEHPDVHSQFMEGKFSVQLGTTNPFARILVYQTLEETVNKDTQTPGGTKGFSLKPGAVSRYYLMSEYRSSYLRQVRLMIGRENTQHFSHPDLQHTRVMKDERDVQAFVELIERSWLNPLSHEETKLVNVSTGVVVPPDIVVDLLQAHEVGEKAYEKFKQESLEADPPTINFYDEMKKQNLKISSHIKSNQTCGRAQGTQIVLKANINLFRYMILVAQSRALPIREVLAHPLGSLLWALANTNGTMCKTNKAAFARELEKTVSPAGYIPKPSTCIIDGMSLIRKLKGDGNSFEQLADSALHFVLHQASDSLRIDMVFDVYRATLIKNAER